MVQDELNRFKNHLSITLKKKGKKYDSEVGPPVFEEHSCSICGSSEVCFDKLDCWSENIDIPDGPLIIHTNFSMKWWCKDCYEDCGGMINAKGISSNTKTPEPGS